MKKKNIKRVLIQLELNNEKLRNLRNNLLIVLENNILLTEDLETNLNTHE
jgi:hypothetical protein